MAERRKVTEMTAIGYAVADRAVKSRILDELCADTGWHRNHARKALKAASSASISSRRGSPRPPIYGPNVVAALTVCIKHGVVLLPVVLREVRDQDWCDTGAFD